MKYMRDLFRGSTGWTRGLAIFAAVLVISLGLCGLNYGAIVLLRTPISGPSVPGNQAAERLGGILIGTGVLELLGMGVGALGLVICFVGLLVQTAIRRPK
jgi:hypothetical protein